jgi:hypothetical protein
MIFTAGTRMVGVSGGHAKREKNLKSRGLATFGIRVPAYNDYTSMYFLTPQEILQLHFQRQMYIA